MTAPTYEPTFTPGPRPRPKPYKRKDWEALGLAHLVEEVKKLVGNEQAHAIESQLARLTKHLLKWHYQPTHRTPSWRHTILNARQQTARRLRNPSLRADLDTLLVEAYQDGRRGAGGGNWLAASHLPAGAPLELGRTTRRGLPAQRGPPWLRIASPTCNTTSSASVVWRSVYISSLCAVSHPAPRPHHVAH